MSKIIKEIVNFSKSASKYLSINCEPRLKKVPTLKKLQKVHQRLKMGQLRTICLTLIGVFLARYGYNHYEKTKRIRVDESPLFAQRLEGTVKEYAARKRIEEVVPGVYAAIDYSLASRYCTKCQK